MERSSQISLMTRDGFRGTVAAEDLPLGREGPVPIRFETGAEVAIPAALLKEILLEAPDADAYALPVTLAQALNRQWTPEREIRVIPLAEERPVVHKRRIETGRVRITKRITTRPEDIDATLDRETVEVERVAVNRPVDGPIEARYEGDTLVIPVLEETLVVEKRLILREELRITRRTAAARQALQVELRREEVAVERIPAGEPEP